MRHKTELVPHSNMSRILFSFFLALHEAFEVAYTCVTTKIESTVQGRIKNLDWTLTRHHHITHTYTQTHTSTGLMLCSHARIIRRADSSRLCWASRVKLQQTTKEVITVRRFIIPQDTSPAISTQSTARSCHAPNRKLEIIVIVERFSCSVI